MSKESIALTHARMRVSAVRAVRKFDELATKDDLTTPDLAAGGLKAPQQAAPRKFTMPTHRPEDDTVKKVVDYQGIPVHVDRPAGHVQTGVDEKGQAWKRVYHVDYGYVPNTQGGDAEGLDVFLGMDPVADQAHWILQKKSDGTFDEYKVMLGFTCADTAKAMYNAHVPKRFFGGMASTSIPMMRALLNIHPAEVMKALVGLSSKFDGEEIERGLQDAAARSLRLVFDANTAKAAEAEQQYILGIVLEPEVVDAQGDIYSADEVKRAAWEYMVNFRNVGLMHRGLVNGKVRLVESYIAPIDMSVGGSTIKAGTWLMGLHVADDGLWGQVKSGGLTGLSIGGFAKKSPPTGATT